MILAIEDSVDDMLILRRGIVKAMPERVLVVARDGQEALDHLANEELEPKMIFLDLKLPKVSGFEVLSYVRETERLHFCPVAVLSSSRLEEDVRRAYEVGANVFLQKPVDYSLFMEIVETATRHWCKHSVVPRQAGFVKGQ